MLGAQHDERPREAEVTAGRAPRRLVVDREVFDVRPSESGHGVDFDWVSGPNPGYGFSSSLPVTFARSGEATVADPESAEADLVTHIRHFLAQIDPDTGYIAD